LPFGRILKLEKTKLNYKMRKQVFTLFIALFIGVSAYAEKTSIHVFVKNYKQGAFVTLAAQGKLHKFELDDALKGVIKLDITKPQWARFAYMDSSSWVLLYLTPGNDVHIEMDANIQTGAPNRIGRQTTVTCEDGGVNDYIVNFQKNISNDHFAPFTAQDLNLTGTARVNRFYALLKQYEDEVDNATFSKEKKSIKAYTTYTIGSSYLNYIVKSKQRGLPYVQDDAYYNKLVSLIKEVSELEGNRIYYDFMRDANLYMYDRGNSTPVEYYTKATKKALEFKNMKSTQNTLISQYLFGCVQRYGIEGTEEMEKIFRETNTNPEAQLYLNSFLAPYKRIAKGAKSPSFNLKDVNGNMVSLESFKGAYVYIDLWATWCGPCKREFPFLKTLEHDYADKNIRFVSISTDRPQDADLWKNMVKEKELGGTQLHVNGDTSFTKAYRVNGIPHFILIDKEGNIVNSRAPRPSSTEIRTLLDSLKGL